MLLVALVVACASFTLVQLVLALRVRAAVPPLSVLEAPLPSEWPRLSIVVPARDEAGGLEQALTSKLGCGYPNLEIVVVDDRSTDETGAIAARLARDDSRLTVARVDALPAGWLGKVHAMSVGVAHAGGEWVLLSDADVHLEPGTLERAIAYAQARDVDLVALMPRMSPVRLALDSCVASMMRVIALAGRVWAANDDRAPVGVGVGAFNLVRKRALDRSDALSWLRMEVVDDAALGALLKFSGARCRLFAARDAVHLVFADRLATLARGLEKGGGLLGFSWVRTAVAVGLWIAVDLGVPLWAVASGGGLAVLGAAHLLLLTFTHVLLARHFRAPLRGALTWPLGVVLGAGMLARAGLLAWWREAVSWRGTRYPRAEIEAGRRWFAGRIRTPLPAPASGSSSRRDERRC